MALLDRPLRALQSNRLRFLSLHTKEYVTTTLQEVIKAPTYVQKRTMVGVESKGGVYSITSDNIILKALQGNIFVATLRSIQGLLRDGAYIVKVRSALRRMNSTVRFCVGHFWRKIILVLGKACLLGYSSEGRITSQMTWYYLVIASLPMELTQDMGDILAVPPSDDVNNHFNAVILFRTTESESNRLRQLLNVE